MQKPDPLIVGAGSCLLKGNTQALNLLSFLQNDQENATVLIVNAGDCRHVLKTIQGLKINKKIKSLNIYVVERNLESLVRQLCQILLVNHFELPVAERAETFLDIQGNLLVSEYTFNQVISLGKQLRSFLEEKTNPFLWNIERKRLKFKEIDQMIEITRDFEKDEGVNASEMLDTRLREYYRERYDHRRNLVDWDIHMKLHDLGATIIHDTEFQRWRNEGIAFPMREGGHIKPNLTIITTLKGSVRGTAVNSRGYWGDIVNGPFFGYGLECEDQKLLSVRDGKHIHSSGQVSMQHMREILGDLDNLFVNYTPTKDEEDAGKDGSKKEEEKKEDKKEKKETKEKGEDEDNTSKEKEEERKEEQAKQTSSASTEPKSNIMTFERKPEACQVTIVPVNSLFPQPFAEKKYFQRLFDVICIDFTGAKELDCISQLCKRDGNCVSASSSSSASASSSSTPSSSLSSTIIIETPKFMLDLANETKVAFVEKIVSDGKAQGWKEEKMPNMMKDEKGKEKQVDPLKIPSKIVFHV